MALALAAVGPAAVAAQPDPAAVMVVTLVVVNVHWWLLYPGAAPFLGLLTALYSVAAYGTDAGGSRRASAAVLAVQPLVVLDPRDPVHNSLGRRGGGRARAHRRRGCGATAGGCGAPQVEMIEERAVRAESERDEQARLAVREERARIAREMHDIVAHSVSVMVVQAGAARRLVDRDPQAAAEAAGLVEATGRDALREMRRAVGVLRAGGDGDARARPPRR